MRDANGNFIPVLRGDRKCKDYIQGHRGDPAHCRLLGFPCINGLRMETCPRKDKGVGYCLKCKKFTKETTQRVVSGNQDVVVTAPIHTPSWGCNGDVVQIDPDKWTIKCSDCQFVDTEPTKHEERSPDFTGNVHICPNCHARRFTNHIAEYFAEEHS